MLTLVGKQVESLRDEVLPVEVRELPDDLARLDRVLSDPILLFPIAQAWEESARERGRPSIAMTTFVRLMVIKHAPAGDTRRWSGRCRTRCTSDGSV